MLKKVLLCATTAVVATLGAAMAVPVASASASPGPPAAAVVYDATTNPLVPMVSEAFEATSTSEFGNEISFAASQPTLTGATVTMDSWACQSGGWADAADDCVTTPGTTFSEPVTLNLYSVGPDNTVGPLLSSTTQTFDIPYRPSDTPSCSSPNNGEFLFNGKCAHGLPVNISFDLGAVSVPDTVIYGISYNTSGYGPHPYGYATASAQTPQGCGYDSLNVALSSTQGPSVGTDPLPGSDFVDSTWGGAYCDNGADGTGTFRWDSVTQVSNGDPAALGCVANTDSPAGNPDPSDNDDYYVPAVQFLADPTPAITGVTPSTGPTGGDTTVTVEGSGFTGATAVTFGSAAATSFTVVSDTQITAVTPTGAARAAAVAVTGPGGTATDAGGFTYVAPPTITSVAPASGPTGGGTTVTVEGTNLSAATSVTVGGSAATVSSDTPTSITLSAPGGPAGSAAVVVTTAGGSATDTEGFTYVVTVPAITSPAAGAFVDAVSNSFTLSAVGTPVPNLSVAPSAGRLPSWLTVSYSGGGAAVLGGTPPAGTKKVYTLEVTASNLNGATTQRLTLTVGFAPTFTSLATATLKVGSDRTFLVHTKGYPLGALSETGALPAGVDFVPTPLGRATLTGVPAPGSGGIYRLTLHATSVTGSATQALVVTVDETPAFTSAASATFTGGEPGTFTVTTSHAYPAVRLSETGTLPSTVTFTDHGNGTASLTGTPSAGTSRRYTIELVATTGSASVDQRFTLNVT